VYISGSRLVSAALTLDCPQLTRHFGNTLRSFTPVGVRLEDDDWLDVAAPFGLDDVFAMVLRPNRALDNAVSHRAKARCAQAFWPEVTVIPWDDAAAGL
jgi:hypothetical protein